MERAKTIKKMLCLAWAGAVCWIYLGSLVNFHQHRIWGHPLIPQVYTNTRDRGKTISSSPVLKIQMKAPSGDSFWLSQSYHSLLFACEHCAVVYLPCPEISGRFSGPIPSLRAPPSA